MIRYIPEKEKISHDYRIYSLNVLNNIKDDLHKIQIKIEIFEKQSEIYFNDIKKNFIKMYNEIDNNKLLLEYNNYYYQYNKNKDNNIKEKLLKDFRTEFINYYDKINIIYDFINDIQSLMKDIKNKIDGLIEFNPPNINSFNDSINYNIDYINLSYSSLYDSYFEEIDNEKCNFCEKKNQAKYICIHCDILLCEECYKKNIDNKKTHQFELIYFKEFEEFRNINKEENNEKKENDEKEEFNYIEKNNNNLNDNEKCKTLFLNSLTYIIKKIILMSNYILSKEKIKLINTDKYNKNIKYIIRKINYPYIKNKTDFDSNLTFLKDINLLLINEFKIENIDINNFHILEIQKELLITLNNIFRDSQIDSFKEALEIIDNNYYSFISDEEDNKN